MRNLAKVATFGLFFVLAHCGSETKTALYTCDYTTSNMHFCSEYKDITDTQKTTASSACTQLSGTAATTACTTTGLLGSCAMPATSSLPAYNVKHYSSEGVTAAIAKAACESESTKGTWTAA